MTTGFPEKTAVAGRAPWREPGQIVDADYRRHGTLRYTAAAREIVGHNGTCFNNRPLYCAPGSDGVVLAGDRPLLRLLAGPFVHGAFAAAILRGGAGRWFHECAETESRYRCGRMTWQIRDPLLPDVRVTLTAAPLPEAAGFAVRLQAEGLQAGDTLLWVFGGAKADEHPRENWDPIMRGNPKVCKTGDPRKPQLSLGLDPESCRGNQIFLEERALRLLATAGAPRVAIAQSDRAGTWRLADASAAASPASLLASVAAALPIGCGLINLRAGQDEVFWAVEAVAAGADPATRPSAAPAKAFEDGMAHLETIEVAQTDTPEPRLDAAVAAVCHAKDANCERNPFVFRHGNMAFHIRFLGWRVLGGATALGWHDRVKGTAAYYAAFQVKHDNERTRPQPAATVLGCHEGPQSRFWGRGRLAPYPDHFYDTQSQFFDQLVREWRWTADPELEETLRPALELHLAWAHDCFDPDDDGLYESYINTLPTDSVWYNGGGSVEESAYVYAGHLAARDLARRAGDTAAAARHQARATKIQTALREVLWLKDRGHFGLYREQGGHQRVHADAWTLSQFLPIDAGLTTAEEGVQALYYTEWALERIRLPFGGVLCQPSNWVPSMWSVRDMFGGDICHLALAYFQTGLADEGWELLLGATLESAYAGAVPGGFSHIGAGTDFADNMDMFARTVVEGLFGYAPDYPNGVAYLRPLFPSAWPRAAIRTPDFALAWQQEGARERYRLTLTQAAAVDFRLPVRAKAIRRVTLNGGDVPWQTDPGFGCSWVRLRTEKLRAAEVVIETAGCLPHGRAVHSVGQLGDAVSLVAPHGEIVGWQDLQQAITGARLDGDGLHGRLARPGHHLVLADVQVGALRQRQAFKLHVTDPAGEAARAAKTPRQPGPAATWLCLDLAEHCQGDVRTIFQQHYLTPRPETCSVRLGTDGYSAWTFPYWREKPPTIDLTNLPKLASGPGRILTPQHVPFTRPAEGRNIAFTSQWDNWPRSVTVPINQSAETVWLLVCGSTFPMQLRIANAAVRFRYADGVVETLELTPPDNFWCLCSWGGLDYSYEVDGFCLPTDPPPTVSLGANCRAMVLSWNLRPGAPLTDLTLETLSQDVVIGLMGVSLANPEDKYIP